MSASTSNAKSASDCCQSDVDAQRYHELLARSGLSASDLLREALRTYHAAQVAPRRDAAQLLTKYVGAGEGPEDLSTNYKSYLTQALENKIPMQVHDSATPPFRWP